MFDTTDYARISSLFYKNLAVFTVELFRDKDYEDEGLKKQLFYMVVASLSMYMNCM
jgi:hypothetical protein